MHLHPGRRAFEQRVGEFLPDVARPVNVGLEVDVVRAPRIAASIAGKISSPFSRVERGCRRGPAAPAASSARGETPDRRWRSDARPGGWMRRSGCTKFKAMTVSETASTAPNSAATTIRFLLQVMCACSTATPSHRVSAGNCVRFRRRLCVMEPRSSRAVSLARNHPRE